MMSDRSGTIGAAFLRVVKAAIAVRRLDVSRASGASVHAYNELCQSVDALALVGAHAELDRMTAAKEPS
jgi:hypothetical protein